MISYLKGAIGWKNENSVVVIINNIGYQVFLSKPFLENLKIGQEKEFFTHEYLREDARELYGFASRKELVLFLELLKVSGVGPRMALNILSLGSERVRTAVMKGDLAILSSISGVGKKTAQKIILELKGTLSEGDGASFDSDAVDALCQLGYSQREAFEALRKVEGAESTEEKIRAALKILGRH